MRKASEVTAATYISSYTGKYGVMYVNLIVMKNGDSGEYISKFNPQTKFVVGQIADYELAERATPKGTVLTIKPVKIEPVNPTPQVATSGANGNQNDRNVSFAMSYAKDIYCALISKGSASGSNVLLEYYELILKKMSGK